MLSITVGNSLVAMVPDLCRHLTYISREHGIQCMPCSTRIISEILTENHTMEKLDFLKTYFSVVIYNVWTKLSTATVAIKPQLIKTIP